MNRSILIILCDFLLLSLLVFSAVDLSTVDRETARPQIKVDPAAPPVAAREDLASVMQLALDDERRGRERLQGELSRVTDTLNQTQDALSRQRSTLAERERLIQDYQNEVRARDQQAQRLAQEKASLELQFAAAESSVQALKDELHASITEQQVSRRGLEQLEAELRKQEEQAKALAQNLDSLAQSNQVMQVERQQLATQLQVVEAEKRAAADLASRMQDEVVFVREEKQRLTQHAERLAEGVKVLASNSGELAREVRDQRPLSPNTIFADLVTNRVQTRIEATRAGFFGGEANRRRDTETILVTDGTNYFALAHVDETPLTIGTPGTDWESLNVTLTRDTNTVAVSSLSFLQDDPRVIFMPLAEADARSLGVRIYQLTADPFKFQEAVVVGVRQGYYGECRFQVDLSAPQYCRMDRNVVKGVFGKFNPSRGDLVFTKNGELLGIMANGTYCVLVQDFRPAGTLQLGSDLRAQRPGAMLARLDSMISIKPFRLQ